MKKLAFVLALSTYLFEGANANHVHEDIKFIKSIHIQDKKEEIEPHNLPKAVKETILSKEKTKSLPIYKAYEIIDSSGNLEYEISFGLEKVEFIKKYDKKGNEIED